MWGLRPCCMLELPVLALWGSHTSLYKYCHPPEVRLCEEPKATKQSLFLGYRVRGDVFCLAVIAEGGPLSSRVPHFVIPGERSETRDLNKKYAVQQ